MWFLGAYRVQEGSEQQEEEDQKSWQTKQGNLHHSEPMLGTAAHPPPSSPQLCTSTFQTGHGDFHSAPRSSQMRSWPQKSPPRAAAGEVPTLIIDDPNQERRASRPQRAGAWGTLAQEQAGGR